MDAKYLKYLTANQFDPEKFLVLNAFITKMAMSKSGANVSVVAIEDPEGVASLGPGCSVVYKKWADGNGISEAYAQQEEQVEAPPKSFEEKVEIAKNIVGDTLTTATPQEAFDVPDPPTKEVVVDQIIANDIVVADIVEQRPVTELNDEEGLDLSVMSARVRYIMDKGYVNSPEDKGYVKDGNRWLDLNVVMSLDDPASFKKYVEDQSAIVWPEVVEEVKADIPDILPPEEKGPAKLTLAEEKAIKNARIEVLKDNGYVQNPKTYTFEKDGHYVSMSDITDYSVGEWRIEKHLKLMEKVPQSLKDIAKESPNVIIASVEPVKEKEPASEVLNNDTDVSNIETDVEVIETNEKDILT